MLELVVWLLLSLKVILEDCIPWKRACGNSSCLQLDFVGVLLILSTAERVSDVPWNIPPDGGLWYQPSGFSPPALPLAPPSRGAPDVEPFAGHRLCLGCSLAFNILLVGSDGL